jgi:hypothetical protein
MITIIANNQINDQINNHWPSSFQRPNHATVTVTARLPGPADRSEDSKRPEPETNRLILGDEKRRPILGRQSECG